MRPSHAVLARRPLVVPMRGRATDEEHRAATPLELFFDLVFVVAVAQASNELHHGLIEGAFTHSVVSFAMVFFAIWWAWMNVTWFASAYDTDDVPYRLATFVQMTGALILAAGIPRAFQDGDFSITTLGYVVMRLALVGQWLRASIQDPPRRATARRFAVGVSACQIAWIVLLAVPDALRVPGFVLFAACELLVPVYAERAAHTTWHPRHIAERYGLFTMIVLGESILAATFAVQAATSEGGFTAELAGVAGGGLVIVFALWWLYFDYPIDGLLRVRAFVWGYGHLPVFAALAAVGAGLAVQVDHVTHHAEIGPVGAGAALTVPIAVYLAVLWILHEGWSGTAIVMRALLPAAAVLVLLAPVTGFAVPFAAAVLVGVVVAKTAWQVAVRQARAQPVDGVPREEGSLAGPVP